MLDKNKSLLKNTGLFALGSFGAKFIYFFLVPLYTNCLTPQEYGTSELINTTVALLFPFLTLSINDGILRYGIIRPQANRGILADSLFVLLVSSILIIACYPALAAFGLFGQWLPLFMGTLLTYQIRSVVSVYLKAVNKVSVFAVDSLIYAVAIGAFNCIALLGLNTGLGGYLTAGVLANLVSIIFQFIVGRVYRDLKPFTFDTKLLAELIRYSVPLIFSAVSWWLIQSSDRYMLNLMMSDSAVGLYAVAAKMPALLNAVTSVFSQAWMLSAIEEYANDRDPKYFALTLSRYFMLLAFVFLVANAVIRPFMNVYVGADYKEAWVYVPVLLYAAIFNALAIYFSSLYKGSGKNVHEMLIVLLSAVVNVIANFVLIPILGIQGACVGTLLSSVFMLVAAVYDTRKFFSFPVDFKKCLFVLLVLFGQLLGVLFGFHPYVVSGVSMCILVVVYRKQLRGFFSTLLRCF